MADFLPEYGQMPWKGHYRPMFKLFTGENWRLVRKDGEPVSCGTAGEAIAAAKECVRLILNPAIRSETIESGPAIPDFLDREAWNRERAERQAEEQQEAFGTIFVRHKPVKVESVKRRRA